MLNQAEGKLAIPRSFPLDHNLSESTSTTSTSINSLNSDTTTSIPTPLFNRNLRILPPALNLQPNKSNTSVISPSSSSGTPTNNSNSTIQDEHPPFDTLNRNLDWLTDQRGRVSSPSSISSDKNTKFTNIMNGNSESSTSSSSSSKLQLPSSASLKAPPNPRSSNYTPVSPCFVHSHLDQLATARPRTTTKLDDFKGSNGHNEEVNEDEFVKLLETAGSVREMSKNLGRTRLISHIQSVMIVTKARDNQLISLTRELALWLMKTPRNGKERGLIVYVDSQLSKSKRFNAEGLERDNPELFKPIPRRYSRTSSSVSLGPLSQSESIPKRMSPLEQLNGDSSSSNKKEENEGQLRYWTNEMCSSSPHLFDFVVTLGGDGTVLYVSWLFQKIVPPIIPISLGSLGFLCNFDFQSYATTLNNAIDNGIRVNLRMRFTCTVYRAIETPVGEKKRRAVRSGRTGGIFMNSLTEDCWEAIESGRNTPVGNKSSEGLAEEGENSSKGKDKEIKCFSTRAVESFEVLNDLVVDRGPSPYVSLLELFSDEHHLTTVQADGLCIATPTGSTAYSLSAGGSLVHPQIPAILITPICPHTLSFRPMLLPDSIELRICVPRNSRASAWASFDGRGRVELKQGDHIKVTASPYPFPTVCADKQSTDWFNSIARTLKWNEREKQKSFVILEESRKKPREPSEESSHQGGGTHPVESNLSAQQQQQQKQEDSEGNDEDESDQEDENSSEGEEFDIDDLSSAGNQTSTNSPTVNPFDPIIDQSIPSLNHSQQQFPNLSSSTTSFRPPHFRETSSAASSTIGDMESHSERFIDGIPKPPRLSQRHSSRDRYDHDTNTRSTPSSAPATFSSGHDSSIRNGVRSFTVVGVDDDDDDVDTEGESDI